CVERVLGARLLLLHRRLGRGADLDDRHPAGQLGQPLLQLLAVVVRRRLLDLGPDLLDAALDGGGLSCTLDERGVVLVHDHLRGVAEIFQLDVLELDPKILGERALPPVRVAMSSSMALRRSPKPGVLFLSSLPRWLPSCRRSASALASNSG